jgi:hypothetical protein
LASAAQADEEVRARHAAKRDELQTRLTFLRDQHAAEAARLQTLTDGEVAARVELDEAKVRRCTLESVVASTV